MFDEGQRLYRAGDMAGAARAFARCAQTGDGPCQLQLGWHYEKGKGVPRNLAEAVKWYRPAAEHNDPARRRQPRQHVSARSRRQELHDRGGVVCAGDP